MRRISDHTTLIAGSATSISPGWRVSDYRNIILQISGSASANLKVFVKGAIGRGGAYDSAPNFTVNKSDRNEASAWDYIEVIDLEDGSAIDGDDGINLSGNVMRLVEINANVLDWLSVHSTGIVAGTVTVVGLGTTNF